jgi:glycerol kinase
MEKDGAAHGTALRVDGGMAANGWLCQFLADILQVPVERPDNLETTALGAAFLAGLATAVWDDLDAISRIGTRKDRFEPRMGAEQRQRLIEGWRSAVARTLSR